MHGVQVIYSTYNVVSPKVTRSDKNRQAVAEFQGQFMNSSDLVNMFQRYVKDYKVQQLRHCFVISRAPRAFLSSVPPPHAPGYVPHIVPVLTGWCLVLGAHRCLQSDGMPDSPSVAVLWLCCGCAVTDRCLQSDGMPDSRG